MTTRLGRRAVLAAALGAAAGMLAPLARGEEMVTEVITVGFRSADELIAILRPLVPRPGSVSGLSNKLVIRTTPSNLAEIRSILAELDRAPANLLISVRHEIDEEIRRDLLEAFGEVREGDVTVSTGRTAGSGTGLTVTRRADGATGGVEQRPRHDQIGADLVVSRTMGAIVVGETNRSFHPGACSGRERAVIKRLRCRRRPSPRRRRPDGSPLPSPLRRRSGRISRACRRCTWSPGAASPPAAR